MKRTLRTLTLAALAACLLTVTALADSGPKPMLTVKVVNAPEGLYYLDLLEADRADVQPYDNNRREDEDQPLDPALVESLLAAVPEGWHACTLDHTNGRPIWGDLLGEAAGEDLRLHTFSYLGVPDTYRVILAAEDGETWVSPVLERTVLQSSVTVDYETKAVTVPPVWRAYAVQLLTTLTTTLVIEGLLLALFGFWKQKRNWLVFLLVNLVTQGGLAIWTAHTFSLHGLVRKWFPAFRTKITQWPKTVSVFTIIAFFRFVPNTEFATGTLMTSGPYLLYLLPGDRAEGGESKVDCFDFISIPIYIYIAYDISPIF